MPDYFDIPALSASRLKVFMGSPEKFITSDFGSYMGDPTPAMRFGTLAHMATLEPEKYDEEVIVCTLSRRTKKFAEFEDLHRDRTIVTLEEDVRARGVARAVANDREAQRWLEECDEFEVPMSKTIRVDGMTIPCKAKSDAITSDPKGWIVDLKTCRDPFPDDFQRQIANLRYWAQAWWYMLVGGFDRFVFIAVRSEYPHEVCCYEITRDDPAWTFADHQCKRALRDLVRRLREGDWKHGQSKTTHPVELPGWYLKQEGYEG